MAIDAWEFVINYLVDNKYGEWYYEIDEFGNLDNKKYKVSEWKGPYHNGRACMEILKRLG
jgi:mannobiose 2-epimerase